MPEFVPMLPIVVTLGIQRITVVLSQNDPHAIPNNQPLPALQKSSSASTPAFRQESYAKAASRLFAKSRHCRKAPASMQFPQTFRKPKDTAQQFLIIPKNPSYHRAFGAPAPNRLYETTSLNMGFTDICQEALILLAFPRIAVRIDGSLDHILTVLKHKCCLKAASLLGFQ